MRLRSMTAMEDEKPGVFWVSFEHNGKPYGARVETDSPEVYEDIEDCLAKGWDACWAKAKKDLDKSDS